MLLQSVLRKAKELLLYRCQKAKLALRQGHKAAINYDEQQVIFYEEYAHLSGIFILG